MEALKATLPEDQSAASFEALIERIEALVEQAGSSADDPRVLEELARVATDGVTRAELQKAKSIVLADFWRSLATIEGKAAALGRYAVFTGNYENLFSAPEEIGTDAN